MSTTRSGRAYESPTKGMVTGGTTVFAGIMLATVAVFQILEGIAAIADDKVYVVGVEYSFQFDVTTWGWIHLVIGVIALATGIGLVAGQTWALLVGILIAFMGALSNFAFMPYYPFWSIAIIAFNVFVIWALCQQLAHSDA